MKTLLAAAWVAPMDSPIIRDGGVVHAEGKIIAAGPVKALKRSYPEAIVEHLGQALLLPGLVNPHTHLELSDCVSGAPPTAGFAEWLVRMLQRGAAAPEEITGTVTRAVGLGAAQCMGFGVTTVGDISRWVDVTRPLLRNAPLRVVSYGEVTAMGQRRALLDERISLAIDQRHAGERLRIGLTPHAPYSVEAPAYESCLRVARERNLPLATHLSESADEREFLAEHGGPLRGMWDRHLPWDEQVPRHPDGPIAMAGAIGLFDYPTLLAHVNYCDDNEMALLARGRASVVYCPRTHHYFGHRPHRWREMLAAGINVAVGTDSCASSPDLNLVDDLRLLHEIAPDVPAETLWETATIRAARAVQMHDALGTIAPGKHADFVAFTAASDNALTTILEDKSQRPTAAWIASTRVL
ncbi:MAG TPA: amidohydrolase family protein [Tepidisphaeraceae bacterium]|nr:amidohydrolase family protein [Tepidisphaeraceae bacterium]